MNNIYRLLAFGICALVAVQASAHVWATAGMSRWIAAGGTLDLATGEAISQGSKPFPEIDGLTLHALNGMTVIPSVALALLVVSFFARVPHGVLRAAVIVGLVALQVTLGLLGHGQPIFGALHGINALALFATAWTTARAARPPRSTPTPTPPPLASGSEPQPDAVVDQPVAVARPAPPLGRDERLLGVPLGAGQVADGHQRQGDVPVDRTADH